jgi:septal ring-binding cell division protein DamX
LISLSPLPSAHPRSFQPPSDDSPWSEKHAAAEEAAPADEIVFEQASTEPMPMEMEMAAEPMSEPMPEPMRFEETAPMMAEPAAIEAETVVEEMSAEDRISGMPAGSYAVQLYASTTASSMARFQTEKDLTDLDVLKTERGGTVYFVLVDLHVDRASANEAAAVLEQKTGSKPWVRSVAGLQNILVK